MCTEKSGESAFSIARVNGALAGTLFGERVHHFATIDSTQTRALADAVAGAEAGQVYLADEQTAGRGRGGHTWHSEPDRGLYLTVLVRPSVASNEVLQLSLATGLAAQAAVREAAGVELDLRWPNDLVVPVLGGHSLKVGGILTEAALTPAGTVRYAAIGIGINLNQAEFAEDLRETATSLRHVAGHLVDRERVAVALLRALDRELRLMETGQTVLERFTAASSWVRGKRVVVTEDDGYTGVTDGLTEDGLLRVRLADESVRAVRHGGVREILSPIHRRQAEGA